jgi:hypothetical protein
LLKFLLGGNDACAPKAIDAMQALANQLSRYELRLPEPFQVLDFLRQELAAEAALQASLDNADSSPATSDGAATS